MTQTPCRSFGGAILRTESWLEVSRSDLDDSDAMSKLKRSVLDNQLVVPKPKRTGLDDQDVVSKRRGAIKKS